MKLKRFFCAHVMDHTPRGPIFSLRSVHASPAAYEYWWAWILNEFTCLECGDKRYNLRAGGRPL